MIHWT